MGNLVDLGKALGLGIGSGLLIAAIVWKPLNKVLDKYEEEALNKVWEVHYDELRRPENESDDTRFERAATNGESRRDSVAVSEAEHVDEGNLAVLVPSIVYDGGLPADSGGVSA